MGLRISKRSSIPALFGGGGSEQANSKNPLSRLCLVYLGHVLATQSFSSSSAPVLGCVRVPLGARGFRDANVLSLAMHRASGLVQGCLHDVVELCHVSDYWIREYRDTSKLGTRRYDEPSFRNGLGPLVFSCSGPVGADACIALCRQDHSAVCPAAIGLPRHHLLGQSSPAANCWSHSSILSWILERLEQLSGWLVVGAKLLRKLLAPLASCLPAHSQIVQGQRRR